MSEISVAGGFSAFDVSIVFMSDKISFDAVLMSIKNIVKNIVRHNVGQSC